CPIIQEQAVGAGAEFAATEATGLHAEDGRWRVSTREGDVRARAVVIASGTTLKTLGIRGEEQLRGKGVSHCASCDAPLLRGRIVGVVGGGDSALQEALALGAQPARALESICLWRPRAGHDFTRRRDRARCLRTDSGQR